MPKINQNGVDTTGQIEGLDYTVWFDRAHCMTPRGYHIHQGKGKIFGVERRANGSSSDFYIKTSYGDVYAGTLPDTCYYTLYGIRYEGFVTAYCSDDSCRVDCVGQPDGFCCIDHSFTNGLLTVLQG